MFFVRIVFFVLLVLLLLPSNTYEKAEFHRKVEQISHDFSTFCDRNVAVCNNTSGFFATLYQKLVTTVEMLEDMIKGNDTPDNGSQQPQQFRQRQRQGNGYDNNRYPTSSMAAFSQNTLTSADLRPAWNGPRPWPSWVSYSGKPR